MPNPRPSFLQRLKDIDFDLANIPKDFICCVSLELMNEPVTLSDGHIYDKESAIDLLRRPLVSRKSPKTREALDNRVMVPAHFMVSQISSFVEEQERKALPEQLKATVRRLEGELANEREENKRLEDDVARLRRQKNALEKQVKDAKSDAQSARALSSRLQNSLYTVRRGCQKLVARFNQDKGRFKNNVDSNRSQDLLSRFSSFFGSDTISSKSEHSQRTNFNSYLKTYEQMANELMPADSVKNDINIKPSSIAIRKRRGKK